MKKQTEEKINRILEKKYNNVFVNIGKNLLDDAAKRNLPIKGLSPYDIVNEGVQNFLKYVKESVKEEKLDGKINERYITSAVKTNIEQAFYQVLRKKYVINKNKQTIKETYYDSRSLKPTCFEEVEVRNFKKELLPDIRSFIRMLEEGQTVTQIIDKLDLGYTNRYYKVKKSLQNLVQMLGYENDKT